MEKRIILAFALSFLILYAFQVFRSPVTPPIASGGNVPEAAKTPTTLPPAEPVKEAPKESALVPAGNIQGEKVEEIVIDMPLYTAKPMAVRSN